MKKFLSLICVITCVLGLTACGEETNYTAYENQKLSDAEYIAVEGFIPILSEFADDDLLSCYKEYTNKEIEFIFEQNGLKVDGYGFKSAADSFNLNSKKTGTITIKEDAKIKTIIDDDKIIIRVPIKGEIKDAEVEMVVSNDMFCTLLSASLNPVSSFGELMEKAALNTLLGMLTVFSVLILISLIISCFSVIPKIQKALQKKKQKDDGTSGIENAVKQITKQEEVLEESDDAELVAAIAAAIAAYEGSQDTSGFVVRSIRKRY